MLDKSRILLQTCPKRSFGYLETLGMLDDCRIVAPIILGYPKSIPSASERRIPEIVKVI
jgi:hypothetical protein